MLGATWQLVRGVGPLRERRLWAAGITSLADLPRAPDRLLPGPVRDRLAAAAAALAEAVRRGDLEAVAGALPARERWRTFGAFSERAVYLDIETDFEGITAVGLLDGRGPRILLAGRDLARFPDEVAPDRLLVTFNGASFDVPVLRRAFPGWRPPRAHVDLRHLWARLGHRGGLKALELREGIGRPDHLHGLDGLAAALLWRRAALGDRGALLRFAEYNLYDVVNLRTLASLGYNRLAAALGIPAAPVEVGLRGDLLYDVTKALLAL